MDIKCEILLCFSNISGKAEVLKSFLLIDFLKFIEKVTADEIYIYTVRNVWVLVNKVGRCCATWLRLRNIFGAPTSSFYSIVLTPPYLVLVKPKNIISNNPIKWRILIQSKVLIDDNSVRQKRRLFYLWWPFLTLKLTFSKLVIICLLLGLSSLDPICPRMPQNELRAFSRITKKYLDKTESFKRLLRKNNHAVIF